MCVYTHMSIHICVISCKCINDLLFWLISIITPLLVHGFLHLRTIYTSCVYPRSARVWAFQSANLGVVGAGNLNCTFDFKKSQFSDSWVVPTCLVVNGPRSGCLFLFFPLMSLQGNQRHTPSMDAHWKNITPSAHVKTNFWTKGV